MNTHLEYLNDTYNFASSAKLVEIGTDEKGSFLILDKTIFYPQGGGQPSDIGIIISNYKEYEIHFVLFVEGQVRHYTKDDLTLLHIGDDLQLKVDSEKRLIYAKIHTAGHLLGSIVEQTLPGVIAVKGFHFPEGPYVEFNSTIESSDELKTKLNSLLRTKLEKSEKIETKLVSYEELVKMCNHVPEYLPKDKPLRVVIIPNLEPVPCGGTHLNSLSEISSIEIRKISSKKGQSKISYTCE